MSRAVYAGSFDPFTVAHEDILIRAAKCFDSVHVAVADNISKHCIWTSEERVQMINAVIAERGLKNCSAATCRGLTAEYAESVGANVLIRGVRGIADYESELVMADLNKRLGHDIETVILLARAEYRSISSSAVKEIARFGGSIRGLVPIIIEKTVLKGLV